MTGRDVVPRRCPARSSPGPSYDLADAAIKRAIIASAHRIIAVADPTKLSRTTLAFVAPVSSLTVVVTTADADQEHTNALIAAGTVVNQA